MRRIVHVTTLCAALTAFAAAPARAAIIIDFEPPFGSNPEFNILFNDPSLTLSGTTVEGITNSTPGTIFHFTGQELLAGNGGQALVDSADGAFTSLLIEPEDAATTYTRFEANLNVLKPARGHASGTVTVTVYDLLGNPTSAQHTIASNGSNFFNVLATGPDLIRAILIESAVDLEDVRQIRVGGLGSAPGGGGEGQVPEPAELLLFGAGLLALARRLRARLPMHGSEQ